MTSPIEQVLLKHQHEFAMVMSDLHSPDRLVRVDMSKENSELMALDTTDTALFVSWMDAMLRGKIGWGGYMEHREMYRRSRHFDGAGTAPRSLHLGIDLWAPAGTALFCPVEGRIHSFADNDGFGNYGPTIILEHQLDGQKFFTLYGHLSRGSLSGVQSGRVLKAGEPIATLGEPGENGHWPPHLHFQVITDLLEYQGDFPGVAALSDRSLYEKLCPDPNLILRCR